MLEAVRPDNFLIRDRRADPLLPAPASGTAMKIWSCISGIPAQTWFYTGDQRISLQGQGELLRKSRYLLSP